MKRFHSRWFRLTLVLSLLLAAMLSAVQVAKAVEFDDDGIIEADEVIDDDIFISASSVVIDGTVNGIIFTTGDTVTINGTVNGDVLMTGSRATINGQVTGSVGFAGRDLFVNGTIGGSLFAAGSLVRLAPEASVGRNLLFTGFSLEAGPGSSIQRDLVANGYQALLAGHIERDILAEVSALEIEGSIGGDVNAKVSAPEEGLDFDFGLPGIPALVGSGIRVADNAEIGGALTYVSSVEQAEAIRSEPAGGVIYETPELAAHTEVQIGFGQTVAHYILNRLRDFITLLVLGALASRVFPNALAQTADQARAKPLPAIGWGLVVLIIGYAGALLLIGIIAILGFLLGVVTLGGLAGMVLKLGFSGLALSFVLFRLAVSYGAELAVAYLIGKLVLAQVAPQYAESMGWRLVVGVVLYAIICLIPVLQAIIAAAATLIGLGAMWLAYREWRSTRLISQGDQVPAIAPQT